MAQRPAEDDADLAVLVRGLLDDLSGTSITRLEVRCGELRVALRRSPGATAPGSSAVDAGGTQEETDRPAHWHAVESPLTGIFYARPAPDQEPYVEVGSHVEPDHVVGLVETMKMFNEVTADVAGTVREFLMENGSLVQAGQALMYIEPSEAQHGPPIGVA